MDNQTLESLVDLHLQNYRQGPGSDAATLQALALANIDTTARLEIADIGCGTGAASVLLAQNTAANITAVDIIPAFLKKLREEIKDRGVDARFETLEADMADLPFSDQQFDVIWSEGAIYNIGFSHGIKAWKKYLKPQGVLAVSEITLLVDDAPPELLEHWCAEYSEFSSAATKFTQLESSGYSPIGYFALPPKCWLEEYYGPLQAGFTGFLERHQYSAVARAIVEGEQKEIALYKKYQEYYSYGFYIAKREN